MSSESSISIQLLSDLHLEIDRGEGLDYENFCITPKVDILALLGDIGTLNENRLFLFLRQQTSQFSKVLYLPGNHEFYVTMWRHQSIKLMRSHLFYFFHCYRTMRSTNWMHLHHNVMKKGREMAQSENSLCLTALAWIYRPQSQSLEPRYGLV